MKIEDYAASLHPASARVMRSHRLLFSDEAAESISTSRQKNSTASNNGCRLFRMGQTAIESVGTLHKHHSTLWSVLPVRPLNIISMNPSNTIRWHKVPDSDEWRCVLHGRLLSLKQDQTNLYYRTHHPSNPTHPTPPETPTNTNDPETLNLITTYFNLTPNLTTLYTQWSKADPNFRKKAPGFTGIRILRQDAWEALVSFICSSNNNIVRISQMVEKLCRYYGPFIATLDGRDYHDFPTPEALTGEDVESRLRSLGFGYRAKYIYQTAIIVSKERGEGWLDGLRNPEAPVLGCVPGSGGEMKPEGREGYRDAHEKLLELQGVGPKVADCVCLMGLGWGEAVPVDTHGMSHFYALDMRTILTD